MLGRELIGPNEMKVCFQTVNVSLESADQPEKLLSQNNSTPSQRAEIVVGEGRRLPNMENKESSLQQRREGFAAETVEKLVFLLPWCWLSVLLISSSDDEEHTHPATLPATGPLRPMVLPHFFTSSRFPEVVSHHFQQFGRTGQRSAGRWVMAW